MSALDTVARPFRGRSHVGGVLRRRWVSIIGETAARASKHRGDKGETVKELTGWSKSSSVGSRRRSGRRINDDDLRWPMRERRCWQRPGASGVVQIGEEEEGTEAVLLDSSGERCDGGGRGGGERRRRQRRVAREKEG